jgi:hypothetical protein
MQCGTLGRNVEQKGNIRENRKEPVLHSKSRDNQLAGVRLVPRRSLFVLSVDWIPLCITFELPYLKSIDLNVNNIQKTSLLNNFDQVARLCGPAKLTHKINHSLKNHSCFIWWHIKLE